MKVKLKQLAWLRKERKERAKIFFVRICVCVCVYTQIKMQVLLKWVIEISNGKYLCWIALKRWWFFCNRWLLNRCAGSTYAILMIMFPSLGLELSVVKGLILTALIKPDCAFPCNSTLGFWINYIVWFREENRVKKNGQLNFHWLSLLRKAACWL